MCVNECMNQIVDAMINGHVPSEYELQEEIDREIEELNSLFSLESGQVGEMELERVFLKEKRK